MKLIQGTVEPLTRTLREMTIDELWHEASSLGGIRVYQYEKDRDYKVTIKFKRGRSEIESEGKPHPDIGVALSNAIQEAREAGAGDNA